ncbi:MULTISPECIES: DUF6708 domain-containing protein [Pseudomonas]|uniref:DUF6708 domain-containing protein n=1 Tax=Pseudomonas TaxID=286 RepID=UPI00293E58A5|nr:MULTISPECIES: DUF6708 domain-containing protein [Pseudomonas]
MNIPDRALGWKYDLPAPGVPSHLEKTATHAVPSPNHIDEAYIEVPRSTFRIRGYWTVGGSILLLAGFIMLIFFTYLDLASTAKVDLESTAIIASSFALAFALTIPYIRMDIGHPRDQPIRFNRHRRKVYFYQYRFDRLNPFGHKNWGVKPVAYDWDDLTAEVYSIYAPLGYGGLLENVMISVRKPGTDEVIDRVFFTSDIEQGKQYWAITRLFMQQGAEALPDFVLNHPGFRGGRFV